MKYIALSLAMAGTCLAQEVVRHVTAGPEDVIHVNTGTFEYSTITLPEGEKAMSYACGDPKHWDVLITENSERFVLVKPSPGAHGTTIQIMTDHNRNYSIKADISNPIDIKLFLDSTDKEAIQKPPSFVPAAEALRTKAELAAAQKEVERTKQESAAEVKRKEYALQRQIPRSFKFDYIFKKDEAPFNVHAVYRNERFTYIVANPEEVASFYMLKDGKPDWVQMEYDDGIYVIRSVVENGYLQIGKKRQDVSRKKPGA